jgi:hypothetical protein
VEKRVGGKGPRGEEGREREELTPFQMLRIGPVFKVAEQNGAGVVLGFRWDVSRIPLDVLLGAGVPDGRRIWYRDLGRDDDELGACVDGSRTRRRNGEGEGREDRGEKFHSSMGVNALTSGECR